MVKNLNEGAGNFLKLAIRPPFTVNEPDLPLSQSASLECEFGEGKEGSHDPKKKKKRVKR